ncbi:MULTISPECIES: 4-hydroxy-tetrahydrodipicolinate synthase [unclassified Paenibacillus]|uniref:4-hydroxy-tetrahydrodipicolinate synthase n=1 Tax=unclassified Paenibacillus TaxID=185978 RepID=UPI002405F5C8|nr:MULTISPECIES: 4-hydroxy-tetrahydrodipicolinate synthase [unclassified Paenibacillus]MDF9841326.1 4-hydroxy-tetrahydrodipicolinate synthase [Paenibacillus sp. PastF-2]MDF9847917.1 4-hydroxy-tetrahydrodipicolinate synthase [Paenibacillus sp. PastM-2]MDF9854485.1 4-hydroxy-tetrahydrodipicolinate synthase [Paenibacillus sp. PastF-1]MDH6479906.1 4-hydroxy-tetrahydrodipicolinate synthase [Paenibacillus sp. PastH-2]MDH6507192.1 4-hydroxy-tetrahydrodipicolinate synthase [Paenibacillus sp. PastM-3]
MDFGRLITAMVTPFDGDGEINWEATSRLVDYLIEEQKSEALVVCGTTGESPTLTDEEKLKLFSFVLNKADGRCKIIAGTGTNSTRHSIHLTKEAEKIGVDGVLLVVPYYNKPNQEGLYQHFSAIAGSTSLPCILYNVPGRTGVSMSAATTLRLAEIPNIVATKECASVDQITLIATACPEDFHVYTGDDSAGLATLAVGGHGIISVAGHIIGFQMSEMIQAYLAGNVKRAGELHRQLFPVFKGLFECPQPLPNPAAVKYALSLRGIDVGSVRLPLVGPDEAEAAFIEALLK